MERGSSLFLKAAVILMALPVLVGAGFAIYFLLRNPFNPEYAIILPFIYIVAEIDDAPGIILMGMVPIFTALVVGVFSAILQKLLNEAIKIKSENDLTV